MKLVCVNNGPMLRAIDDKVNLTIGKIYESPSGLIGEVYNVINDKGKRCPYYYERFEPLYINREKKLKKLGI